MKKIFYLLILCIFLIIPAYFIEGQDEYKVVVIHSDGTIENIATYSNYDEAYNTMINYDSTLTSVSSIYRNGQLVNAEYGVFRFNTSSTVTFDTDYGTRYVSGSYNSEAALINYDPNTNKVEIKISGVVGWVNLSQGQVQPISYLSSSNSSLGYDSNKSYVEVVSTSNLRFREAPGTSSTQIGCSAGVSSCSTGVTISKGNIVEWVNKGNVVNVGGYDWYQVVYNGTTGYVASDPSSVYVQEFIPVLSTKLDFETYYYVYKNGNLIHQYYATASAGSDWYTNLGPAPTWLSQGVNYYSFDGNYFYDDFTKMIDDYRNNTYDNAVNELPYYNYYQYLPSRTQTIYTAENINAYIGSKYTSKINRSDYYVVQNGEYVRYNNNAFPSNQSMLYGEGQTFIDTQNTYGVNAAQTFALAINESGWGRSTYAVREYNMFGHNAVDSNPDLANSYESVAHGIEVHARDYIVGSYSNPINGTNYNGGHYGNKLSGNNVKYASDAYWGEKMAGQYFLLDNYYGKQEFRSTTTGIKQGSEAVLVKSEPNNSSTTYYSLKAIPDITVAILDTVIGEEINGNNIWYKIQSDVPIDQNRNVYTDIKNAIYNYEYSYAYVHSSSIYVEQAGPVITASDIEINKGDTLVINATAFDAWNGYSNVAVSHNVDVNKVGIYPVTLTSTDLEGNTSTKVINVTVKDNEDVVDPEIPIIKTEVENEYYFDSLTEDSGIKVKGFLTMLTVDNSLATDITYTLQFINNQTLEVIEKPLSRLTENIPFFTSENTYNWFEGNVDISDISAGDYTLYIKAETATHTTTSALSNVFGVSMATVINTDTKSAFIRNNYETREAPIEVFIRDENIGEKTTSSLYNLITEYSTINFVDNNLVIKGAAHTIGGDYSLTTDVTRTLTFENISTFDRTTFDIGSITTGDYGIELRVPDGFDKTKAWFETSIDVSSLEKGTYSIYINTISNVSDIGELQDIFRRNIASTLELDGKTYRLEVDLENRFRILLIVE